MKIFSMNDCDWMAAETLDEAKIAYREMCGTRMDEEELFCDPGEITETQYDKLNFCDDDGEKRSFRAQLQLMVQRGEKFPAFFATTEY